MQQFKRFFIQWILRENAFVENDPAISFIYPKHLKTFICKDFCISMFTAALFMVAKIWTQTKCLLIND